MRKKGFTLTELLVVIAIIGVITLIAVPSIITVNKSIKQRTLNSKKELIVNAAELYAQDNPDIFNGVNEVKIYVYELIDNNLIKADVDTSDSICSSSSNNTKGCYINPVDNSSMNGEYVTVRKEAIGVVGEYGGSTTDISSEEALVHEICQRFSNGHFVGKYGTGANDTCACTSSFDGLIATGGAKNGQSVNACIISGSNVDNYLKYDNVMWRVMGLYNLDGKLSAKMITDKIIDGEN